VLSRPIPSRAANRAQRNPVLSPSRRQSSPPRLAPYLCRIVTRRSARTLDEAAGRFRPAQKPGSKTPSARSPPSQGRRTPRLKFRALVSNACSMDRRKGCPTRESGIPVPVRRCRCVRSPIFVRLTSTSRPSTGAPMTDATNTDRAHQGIERFIAVQRGGRCNADSCLFRHVSAVTR